MNDRGNRAFLELFMGTIVVPDDNSVFVAGKVHVDIEFCDPG